jgi:hypothetical protein
VRVYGTYPTVRWTDHRMVPLGVISKLIDVYLFTSPHTTMIGCFRIPLAYIAADLNLSQESIAQGIDELVSAGLIVYDQALSIVLITDFFESGLKWNDNQCLAAVNLASQLPKKLGFLDRFLHILEPNLAALRRKEGKPSVTVTEQQPNPSETLTKPLPNDFIQEQNKDLEPEAEPVTRKQEEKQDRLSLIEHVFAFYCEALNRNPKQYTLTADRRKKAMLRLEERMVIHKGDMAAVEREFVLVVENLSASDWNRDSGNYDWTEQIFRSTDVFEKRLNWQKTKGGNNAGTRKSAAQQRSDEHMEIWRDLIAGEADSGSTPSVGGDETGLGFKDDGHTVLEATLCRAS